jgi:hypothetical protein
VSTKNLTIPEELAADQLAIENGLANEEIKALLAEVGYIEAKLKVGQGLYHNAAKLTQTQTSEHGDQYGATDTKGAAFVEANQAYMSDVKLARVAIKNRGDRSRLALDGDRKQDYAGWKNQTDQFYETLFGDVELQTQLMEVNLTLAKLQAHAALVAAVEAARLDQATEKGEAEDSTDERNAALAELRAWMSDYLAAARVALQDHPQLLEALGVVARSGPAASPKVDPAPTPPPAS